MSTTDLETKHLTLVLQTREETRARIASMQPAELELVSSAWLAQLERPALSDPWIDGFAIIGRTTGDAIGKCGFKGPPDTDGLVEIAYAVSPEHEGKGYATEAAAALVVYAFGTGNVRVVRAHTLPEPNASGRVLMKCGFTHIGEVLDPEDGLVWRWESPCPSRSGSPRSGISGAV